MELPIVEFPIFIEEMSADFIRLFKKKRQFKQFKRITRMGCSLITPRSPISTGSSPNPDGTKRR
ncbi:MAG: hypothetical protein ACXQS6_04270 [Candidatus Syntropharchaeales archaeon]